MTQSPAGWHRDQTNPSVERYWDGNAWTDQTREAAAAPPPQNYAPQPPAKKKHTVRNIIIGFIVVCFLGIAGCLALVGTAVDEADKAIKKKDNKPGGKNNPLTIVEGKAFEIDRLNYAGGWKVKKDAIGDVEPVGFKVTNNRDEKDEAIVEVKFRKGTEILASVDCTTDQIATGDTVTLNCFSGDDFPTGYDKITINDTF